MYNYAPVAVYTYNRLEHFKKTIESLRCNNLAQQTELYIVSDAAKDSNDYDAVEKIREYSKCITGFKFVHLIFRDRNLGALESIYSAEREIIDKHGVIISMEDDNITANNFLEYMNQALAFYKDDFRIYSICGYCPPVFSNKHFTNDNIFYHWNLSWGYATWKNKYDLLNPLDNKYNEWKERGVLKKLIKLGGLYIMDSLRRDYLKQASFPDAILCTKMTESNLYSVIPSVSKIKNIGSDGSGASVGVNTNKYDVELDSGENTVFKFAQFTTNEFEKYSYAIQEFYNGSLLTRIARRIGLYNFLFRLKMKFKNGFLK